VSFDDDRGAIEAAVGALALINRAIIAVLYCTQPGLRPTVDAD
jgi:hypothetical protein